MSKALWSRINSCNSILFSKSVTKKEHNVIISRIISSHVGIIYIETPGIRKNAWTSSKSTSKYLKEILEKIILHTLILHLFYLIELATLLTTPLQNNKIPSPSEYPGYNTKLHLKVRSQSWSSGKCGVPHHYHYSQVHSDLKCLYLLRSYLLVKYDCSIIFWALLL